MKAVQQPWRCGNLRTTRRREGLDWLMDCMDDGSPQMLVYIDANVDNSVSKDGGVKLPGLEYAGM